MLHRLFCACRRRSLESTASQAVFGVACQRAVFSRPASGLTVMQHFGEPAQPFMSFYGVVAAPPPALESSQPCGLTAKFNVVSGKQQEFLAVMQDNIKETNKEPGMVLYDLNTDIFDPTVFWLIEKWRSVADLAAHTQTPHYAKTGEGFTTTGCLHSEHACLVSLYGTGFDNYEIASEPISFKVDALSSLTQMAHFGGEGRPFMSFYEFIAKPPAALSSESPCGLTAKFNIVPGKQEAFLDVMRPNIACTMQEEGVLLYDLNRDIYDPTVFWLIEKWRSMADLAAHTQTPHYAKTGEGFAGTACLHPEHGCLVSLYKTGH